MVKEIKTEKADMPNLKVLREIRINAKAQKVGSVISKKEFDRKGDWLNLCNMTPPRLAQTDEKVGPAPEPAKAPAAPTAGKN